MTDNRDFLSVANHCLQTAVFRPVPVGEWHFGLGGLASAVGRTASSRRGRAGRRSGGSPGPNEDGGQRRRRGAVLVLAAALMVVLFAFVAFTVDVGYITLTRTQLQAAADSAALGAALELRQGLGPAPQLEQQAVVVEARNAAQELAALHQAADRESVYLEPTRDVQFGRCQYDPETGRWVASWGVPPFNAVRVTLHRDVERPEGSPPVGDEPLRLFFAPVIGQQEAGVQVRAAAALLPGVGFRIPPGSSSTAPLLPITVDEPSWEQLLAGVGSDHYAYNPATGEVTPGSDGILELNIYPGGTSNGNSNGRGNPNSNANNQWTPGNRGTIDIGNPNNATPDLERQILYGVNAQDLSYFGGEFRLDQGPIDVNGDTGLSAAIKDELEAIIGQTRAIALFSSVTGQGNNTTYTLVKLVGVRIMAVKLTGANKYVYVQPAAVVSDTVIPSGDVTVSDASLFTTPRLIE